MGRCPCDAWYVACLLHRPDNSSTGCTAACLRPQAHIRKPVSSRSGPHSWICCMSFSRASAPALHAWRPCSSATTTTSTCAARCMRQLACPSCSTISLGWPSRPGTGKDRSSQAPHAHGLPCTPHSTHHTQHAEALRLTPTSPMPSAVQAQTRVPTHGGCGRQRLRPAGCGVRGQATRPLC